MLGTCASSARRASALGGRRRMNSRGCATTSRGATNVRRSPCSASWILRSPRPGEKRRSAAWNGGTTTRPTDRHGAGCQASDGQGRQPPPLQVHAGGLGGRERHSRARANTSSPMTPRASGRRLPAPAIFWASRICISRPAARGHQPPLRERLPDPRGRTVHAPRLMERAQALREPEARERARHHCAGVPAASAISAHTSRRVRW